MPIEIYESKDKFVRFYFSHSDKKFTTGVMVLEPGSELAKHSRPLAIENLTQISGKCVMKIFEGEKFKEIILQIGNSIIIPVNTSHIHLNLFSEPSVTFFRADGDNTEGVNAVKKSFKRLS